MVTAVATSAAPAPAPAPAPAELKLSVVCPVYNEGANIAKLFERLEREISIPMEVIIVYDKDDDDTLPALDQLHPPFLVRRVKNHFGRGALNAIKSGFMEARCEATLVIMADLADDLSAVPKMFELVRQGYDVVCGSRYMRGGKQIGGPFLKTLFSRTAGLSMHYLAGVPTKDSTNSFKMYRTSFLRSLEFESSGGFEIGMEVVVKAYVSGGRVAEVPSTWTDRVAGESRFRMWKWMPNYLRWYFYAFRGRLP
jgi:glycosyltransferase involved in cell wall biosynthesis